MMDKIHIRNACENDADFIVQALIEAEKCSTDVFTYSRIFNIPEPEMRDIIKKIVLEDVPGQELCISQFLIAETDGEYIAAACAWVEGKNHTSSSFIKSSLLSEFISEKNLRQALPVLNLIKEIEFKRHSGSIQHEGIYVKKKFRMPQLANQLIMENIKKLTVINPSVKKSQGQIMGKNYAFIKMLNRIGFEIVEHKKSTNTRLLRYLPDNSRYLVERYNR